MDFKRIPGTEPALPKVVAHNLTRAAAERWEAQLANDSVEGQPTGWMPYLWEYTDDRGFSLQELAIHLANRQQVHCLL